MYWNADQGHGRIIQKDGKVLQEDRDIDTHFKSNYITRKHYLNYSLIYLNYIKK